VQRRGVADVRDARLGEPEPLGQPRRQRRDALRVLARVVVAVLGGEREPPQHLEPQRVEVAPPADGQRGEGRLQVARAALQRGAVEQRAQAPHGAEVVVLARHVEIGGRDERRTAAQVERVQEVAQLGRGRTQRDDDVGRAGQRGLGGRLGVDGDRDLGGTRREASPEVARGISVTAGDEHAGAGQRVVHNRASWRNPQTRAWAPRSRGTASRSGSAGAGWAWCTAPST
jgi:hypothetical protein